MYITRLIDNRLRRYRVSILSTILVLTSSYSSAGLPINGSGIKFESTNDYRYEGGPTLCNTYPNSMRLLEDPVRLTDIGIKAEDIEKGVNCLAGDFDKNGYLDFLFWKGEFNAEKQKYKAVYFHKKEVLSTKHISSRDKFSYWSSSYAYGKKQTVHSIANLSGINLGGTLLLLRGHGICRAPRKFSKYLQQIGLERDTSKSGSPCIVEDLDANGSYDFVFVGPFDREALFATDDSRRRETLSPKILILFFQNEKTIQHQFITNHGYDHIDVYGPRDNQGEFGEPKTKIPGLIQYGEGGTTTIYLYDAKTKLMNSSEFASEWH